MGDTIARFPIRFESWYRPLSTLFGLPPSSAYVEVGDRDVAVRMGWAFSARFPRSAVASTSPLNRRPLSRGVHGFAGRWLVNGSGRGIIAMSLRPPQRAYVCGVPIRLRELFVSVNDPQAAAAALRPA
jgi:hypothetical protein